MAKVVNSISSTSSGTSITVVANYSALPDPTTVSGQFYWCENSQGTAWLPGSLGGTYYSAGQYYSNGTSWSFIAVPYQATQDEVNTGTNTDKFVTPSTLSNSTWAFTTAKVLATVLSGLSLATGGEIVSTDTVLQAFGKLQNQINSKQDKTTVFKNTTQAVVTGTTGEVIIYAEEVLGNSISNNTILSFKNRNYRNPRAGTCVYKLYINTVNNLSGSPVQIGRFDASTNHGSNPFEREYLIKDNTLSGFQFNTAGFTDLVAGNVNQGTTTYNINTTYYWILTAQPNTSSDSLTHSFSILERI